jgi:hypothetical protein
MTNDKNQTGLIKADQSLDLVPTTINARRIAESGGHREEYLVDKCQKYNLSLRNLDSILDMKEEYRTHLPKIFELIDEGYSLQEVNGFLEIRDLVSTKQDSVSLVSLSKFCNKFGYDPVDTETVQGKVEELHQLMNREHYGTSISNFVDLADSFGVDSYDMVFSFLEKMQQSRAHKADQNEVFMAGKRKHICGLSRGTHHRSTDNHYSYSEKSKP